jgi:hypothetical protein
VFTVFWGVGAIWKWVVFPTFRKNILPPNSMNLRIFFRGVYCVKINILQNAYSLASQWCVRAAWHKKRPEKLSEGIILLHDNAPPFTANFTTTTLVWVGWEMLTYPRIWPLVTITCFDQWRSIWEGRNSRHEELKRGVLNWLRCRSSSFLLCCRHSALPRPWQKCVSVVGKCIGKEFGDSGVCVFCVNENVWISCEPPT